LKQRIYISNLEDNPDVGAAPTSEIFFETGLDARAFARTKLSQTLVELGYIVSPALSETWKAAGVKEIDGFMRVFGPMFPGKRLDLLLENSDPWGDFTALESVICWIRAKLQLSAADGDNCSANNPGAAFIYNDKVFFAPQQLANHCLYAEGQFLDIYNSPDLFGTDAAAFCAGVMLYKILIKTHPYEYADIYQNMRDGVFLPPHIAAPEMNEKLSNLIQSALLLPVAKKQTLKSGTDILGEIYELLKDTKDISSLFCEIPAEKKAQAEKEKKNFVFKQNITVKTKRFVIRNKFLLTGITAGFIFALIVIISIYNGYAQRPTTKGMAPDTVVSAYYEAFSLLDHMFMEACIMRANRTDINIAISYTAMSKARQAYEHLSGSIMIAAEEWKLNGGELPAPNVFGITDLIIDYEGEDDGKIKYHASYILWFPQAPLDEGLEPLYEFSRNRTDKLTLKTDRRNNWRITEILRTEQ